MGVVEQFKSKFRKMGKAAGDAKIKAQIKALEAWQKLCKDEDQKKFIEVAIAIVDSERVPSMMSPFNPQNENGVEMAKMYLKRIKSIVCEEKDGGEKDEAE